ncbi:PG0541 family transporter-associated protein [Cetobacterium sp. SF1]|uniref:PG0541 family transporter-associated protein n=1 Tax=unclassified Cetobacterium TaxID=2630983 RepID=UPI003CED29FC
MDDKSYKLVYIYINQSQKRSLEEFFEKINFAYYAIQSGLESVWEDGVKHKNNPVWPGTDCLFWLTVDGKKLPKLIGNLKWFRMNLPENVIMSVTIIPVEKLIPNLFKADIEPIEPENI